MWHTEITRNIILGVFPLLVAYHGYRLSIKLGNSGYDGSIIAIQPVTVQFNKISKQLVNQIKRSRTL